ncbi:hypothetical protein SAMN04489712_109100 [Thermomonospora echinospora]|uniref:Secreted protein n=1 Tax=Thermomonospora echinospora TaxID=1992 RepID=A0A1H6CA13_9ACTN|nr:hypothetical protein [Thermomonospora echinospora]SEG69597.1 hypothetical protein SAMN04489712_109100 [Thermomonospora echinospora]
MLKRLAAAGILSVAAGGVLMSATPAMAGGDHDKDIYSNHHNVLANKCDIDQGNEHNGLLGLDIIEDVALLAVNSANDIYKAECEQSNAILNKNH